MKIRQRKDSFVKAPNIAKARLGNMISAFEIRVSAEAVAVEIHDFLALLGRDAAIVDGFFREVAELGDEFLGVELHVGEHVGDGVAFDLVGIDGLAFLKVDADDVGVAEEVVEVAEGFLVGADEEDAEVIGFVRLEILEMEDFRNIFLIDEAVDLTIAVTGDVGDDGAVLGRAPPRSSDRLPGGDE